jgi:hypothetical protein
MPITENTPQRLVLRSGSNTLTLDKDAGTASLGRKMLFFKLKPVVLPLSDFVEVKLDEVKDPVSGAIVSHTMLIARSGTAWVFGEAEKKDAEATIAAVRGFLGLA